MMAALDAMRTDKIEQANQQVNEEISDYRECLIWTDAQAVGNFANYADAFGSRIFLPMALTPDVDHALRHRLHDRAGGESADDECGFSRQDACAGHR